MNNLNLTKEEVSSLLYEENILDENDEERFIFVKKKFLSHDPEKSHVEYTITIKEVATGKFWKANLGESPWYLQSKTNAQQTWVEVQPKTKKTTEYE